MGQIQHISEMKQAICHRCTHACANIMASILEMGEKCSPIFRKWVKMEHVRIAFSSQMSNIVFSDKMIKMFQHFKSHLDEDRGSHLTMNIFCHHGGHLGNGQSLRFFRMPPGL